MGLFDSINGNELKKTLSDNFNATDTGKLANYIGKTGKVYGFIFKKTNYGLLTMLACDFDGVQVFVGVPGRYTDLFQNLPDEAIEQMITRGATIKDIKEVDIKNGPNKGKKTVVFTLE